MVKEDKGFYDKKIVYLDYLERNSKVKNGGFLKWETKGETSRIQIHIRGLYPTDTIQAEIQIVSKSEVYPADRIALAYGTGEYAAIWKNEALAGTAISYDECDGIQIRLSENRMLKGIWRERKRDAETASAGIDETVLKVTASGEAAETVPEVLEATPVVCEAVAKAVQELAETEKGTDSCNGMKTTEIVEKTAAEEAEVTEKTTAEEAEVTGRAAAEEAEVTGRAAAEEAEVIRKAEIKEAEAAEGIRENGPEEHAADNRSSVYRYNAEEDWHKVSSISQRQTAEKPAPLSGDKWEQLGRHYPRIHPFGDDREYLSITPRDFVVLSRQYQSLVQNSFLLHGYYNYGHVILTKIREREEDSFYLGVPGVYFDREKQAALMFGFEGFEAGTDCIAEGGFGYYMKRVEI